MIKMSKSLVWVVVYGLNRDMAVMAYMVRQKSIKGRLPHNNSNNNNNNKNYRNSIDSNNNDNNNKK
jgi:hypothetical protein